MQKDYADYLINKTKEDYNLISDDFSRTRKLAWDEIEFLFYDYLKENDRVLDLGCGNGRYYPLFKEKKADYRGTDFSEKLVEIAKKRYPEVSFQVSDAPQIPFPDNFFDKVYSIAVLHHLPSEEYRLRFLSEAKRVLKPGGRLVLTVWQFHRLKERRLILKYTILRMIGKSKLDWNDVFEPWGKSAERYYHCFSQKELEGLAKKIGFKIEKSGVVKNPKGNRQNIFLVAKNM